MLGQRHTAECDRQHELRISTWENEATLYCLSFMISSGGKLHSYDLRIITDLARLQSQDLNVVAKWTGLPWC